MEIVRSRGRHAGWFVLDDHMGNGACAPGGSISASRNQRTVCGTHINVPPERGLWGLAFCFRWNDCLRRLANALQAVSHPKAARLLPTPKEPVPRERKI